MREARDAVAAFRVERAIRKKKDSSGQPHEGGERNINIDNDNYFQKRQLLEHQKWNCTSPSTKS